MRPEERDDQHRSRDLLRRLVTSGDAYGTTGEERRGFWQAFAAICALMIGINVVNVLTVLHDRARDGHPVAAWEPTVWEFTSGAMILVLVLAAYPPVSRLLRRLRGWPARIAVNAAACLVLSVLHVCGMAALRHLIYRAVGEHYRMGLSDFPYEFRKDVLAYALLSSLLWQWRRAAVAQHARATVASPVPIPATFDIKEGARTLRTPVADILAVSSAGNYVEVALADGRRPLMRSTLAAMEADLARHNFLRTHRSWLVNPASVRAIAPEGSGDYRLELTGGLTAPLSRRFPEALQRLRGT